MSVAHFEVELDKHHLEELAARPLTAIRELVWNSLDADADTVDVSFARGQLGGVEEIRIADNGHGMTRQDAEESFRSLGGSWKLTTTKSKTKGRILHGKHGRGRFRAAGIGQLIRWETVAESEDARTLTRIEIRSDNLRGVDISDPESTDLPIGTKVLIAGFSKAPEGLGEGAVDRLLSQLAIYIEQYGPAITFDGIRLDPTKIQAARTSYELAVDVEGDVGLEVIEWTRPVDRALHLCNAEGIALDDVPVAIRAPGYDFTGYVRWTGFEDEGRLFAPELDPASRAVIEAAREQLRAHFRERADAQRRQQLEEWKTEEVYPFDSEPAGPTEVAARELFEVVAVTARDAVNAADKRGRQFSLRLLKEAMEQDPGSLQRVLEEVLDLPEEQLEALNDLLEKTSLTKIISATRAITNRLDFLQGVEGLVLDPDHRRALLERSQLHRILADETWVFGEEYALAVDDQSLKEALRRHVQILGRNDLAPEQIAPPIEDPSGRKQAIVDLMLARSVPLGTKRREHLVVELKRPSVKIGPAEIQQIKDYAIAVVRDGRFDKVGVQWDFIVVSTELTGSATEDARQAGVPAGLVASYEDGRVRVWARTWGELLEDANHRLKYVRDQLEYAPSTQQAFEYLRAKHAEYLPATAAIGVGDVPTGVVTDDALSPEHQRP